MQKDDPAIGHKLAGDFLDRTLAAQLDPVPTLAELEEHYRWIAALPRDGRKWGLYTATTSVANHLRYRRNEAARRAPASRAPTAVQAPPAAPRELQVPRRFALYIAGLHPQLGANELARYPAAYQASVLAELPEGVREHVARLLPSSEAAG